MTTTEIAAAPARYRVPASVRGAQALLLLPLGALQLVASISFSIADGLHGVGDHLVAAWAVLMSCCCITVALRLGRRQAFGLRAALLLLAAQGGFCAVKLGVYHESASLVFLALVAVGAGLLARPASRRHFVG